MSDQLSIKCLNAQLTRDTQMFSNMDPYVVIQCGTQKRKTRTHQQGGKRPQWKDQFTFSNLKANQVKFTVWDQDVMDDDKVGQGSIDISKFISKPNVPEKQYITLTYKGRPAGKLNVQITYKSNTGTNNTWGNNNNSQGWNNSINSQGWNANNNSQGWNANNNSQGTVNNNNTQGWNSNTKNMQGWGANNNSSSDNGWNTQNNLNNSCPNNNNTNQQGWGNSINSQGWNSNNNSQGWNSNIQGWNANIVSNTVPNINTPQIPLNIGYQLMNNTNNTTPVLQKKQSSNNQVNPYGNVTTQQTNENKYPSLEENQKSNQNNQFNQNNIPIQNANNQHNQYNPNLQTNPNVQNNSNIQPNPIMAMMGAKMFGQSPKQPEYNPNSNAFNILNMAVQNGNQQPPTNNIGGWGQPQNNWGQPNNPQNEQSWGQNPQNVSGWGVGNQPQTNNWQSQGNNWGSGW